MAASDILNLETLFSVDLGIEKPKKVRNKEYLENK
jgi:hypothetical protein